MDKAIACYQREETINNISGISIFMQQEIWFENIFIVQFYKMIALQIEK